MAEAFARTAGGGPLVATDRVVATVPARSGSRTRLVAGAAVLAVIAVAAAVWSGQARQGRQAAPPAPGSATPNAAPQTPAPVVPAAPAGVLMLARVPAGARILVNGRPATSPMSLQPGRAHVVEVSAEGFRPWRQSLTVTAGDTLRRAVELRADTATSTTAPTPTPAAATGYLTVGSRPLSAMTINGRAVSSNPVSNLEVAAGLVTVRFTVTDSSGTWSRDTTVAVAPGERKTVGYVRLVRP